MNGTGRPGRAQVLWRCRRGLRELDCLLIPFARRHWARLDPADQARFLALLELPDPLLLEILMARRPPDDPALAPLVRAIRRAAGPA